MPPPIAYMVTKQHATGCFHEEAAGLTSSDVHVIDLESAEEASHHNNDATEKAGSTESSTSNILLPAVYLSLAPETSNQHLGSEASMRRNLTLILHSNQRVKWYLESRGLSGQLQVISTNGPVENYSLASGQELLIEERPLPAAFDQLWRAVVTKTGSNPLSYAHINVANVISIVVPPKLKKKGLWPSQTFDFSDNKARLLPDNSAQTNFASSQYDPSSSDQLATKTILIPGRKVANANQDLSGKYRSKMEELRLGTYMIKKCNQKQTIVTLPLSKTNRLNVSGVTLNDPHCRGTKNQTHWILTTKR